MASNHKLTSVIKGRTISGTGNSDDTLTINFTDGSKMAVKTKGSTNSASTGGTVEAVRQTPETLTLAMEGGATLEVPLAEATSSVLLRDGKGGFEYAD